MNTLKNLAEAGVFAIAFTAIVLAAVFAASAVVSVGLVAGMYITGGNILAGLIGAIGSTIGGMWLTNKVCG